MSDIAETIRKAQERQILERLDAAKEKDKDYLKLVQAEAEVRGERRLNRSSITKKTAGIKAREAIVAKLKKDLAKHTEKAAALDQKLAEKHEAMAARLRVLEQQIRLEVTGELREIVNNNHEKLAAATV